MQVSHRVAPKSWTKPEVLNLVSAKYAQIGNDNQTVDQLFPASNGSTPAS